MTLDEILTTLAQEGAAIESQANPDRDRHYLTLGRNTSAPIDPSTFHAIKRRGWLSAPKLVRFGVFEYTISDAGRDELARRTRPARRGRRR
jgi:hypothetical protein